MLATSAVFLALVLGLASYSAAQSLGQLVYHEDGYRRLPLALTPSRFQLLRNGLSTLALLATGLLLWLRRSGIPSGLSQEIRAAGSRIRIRWCRLPAGVQAGSMALVLLLVAVRSWYFWYYPLGTDEVASYDYFVRPGLLAITSFYPIPNNHIFYNLLAWPLAQLGLPPRGVMRLPTLLVGTMGTAVGLSLLSRLLGWRRAMAITTLLGLAPLWVYYGAAGRGYFVQLSLLQLGFFATLELLRPASPYQRLSWLVFVGTGILGLYTVPSYAYPLLALDLGLGAGLLQQGRWPELGFFMLSTIIILATTLLLYSPVGAISGWAQLMSNRYVAAKPAAVFWSSYRAFLYETASDLLGPSPRYSGPIWLGLAVLGGVSAWFRLQSGILRRAALLAWLLLALPLVLMAAQRVNAPVRTLLYLPYAVLVLVVLLLGNFSKPRRLIAKFGLPVMMLLLGLLGGYRLQQQQPQVLASRHETQQLQQAFSWLQNHPAGPVTSVWLNAPLQELFFAHYASQQDASHMRLRSGRGQWPTAGFDYLVLNRKQKRIPSDSSYREVYRDQLITIYAARR